MLTKDTKLRFWCQKVLPLVYDDSLSYYELLNKVVLHLNQHTEDINALIDFYDTFTEDVEDIIRQMMDDGEFNEIIADTIGSMIAAEYDPEHQYIIFDYCVYNSKLYRANASTTGEFDPEKWDERNVGYDLTTIQNYIYSLNAGNVAFDSNASYNSGTVGNKLKTIDDEINAIHNEIIIEQGGIADATGIDAENNARLRTKGYLPPYFTIIVNQPTTHNIRVKGTYYYDENNNFVQYLERNSYQVTVDNSTNPNGYKVRLAFWAENETDEITPSDLIISTYHVDDGIQTQIDDLNNTWTLYNLNKFQLARQSYDRLQLKGVNGIEQYVVEFNPLAKAIKQSHTLDGSTFINDWELGIEPTPIIPTMASQTDYTFDAGGELAVIQCGKIVQVNGGFICNTPTQTSPGTLIATGLPHSKTNTFVTLAERNGTNTTARAIVNTSGELYLRFGHATCNYDCAFTYITE